MKYQIYLSIFKGHFLNTSYAYTQKERIVVKTFLASKYIIKHYQELGIYTYLKNTYDYLKTIL